MSNELLERRTVETSVDGRNISFSILPNLGANLCSLQVDGRELLYFPEEGRPNGAGYAGCFHMYPTPCRIPDGVYTFQGSTFTQKKRGEVISIHGLMRDESVRVEQDGDVLRAAFEIFEEHDAYEGYPFPSVFELTFEPVSGGLQIQFRYENKGHVDAPFGYGLHPFWLLGDQRDEAQVRVPCRCLMDLANLIPTGGITPVDNLLDLREPTALRGMDLDNLFWDRDVQTPALVRFPRDRQEVVLEASPIFNHMIAYAPANEPFVCVEFLTCAPNHINLYNEGHEQVSGLQVVAPGDSLEGWVRYTLRDMTA
jgi:aldose 1-epimerase